MTDRYKIVITPDAEHDLRLLHGWSASNHSLEEADALILRLTGVADSLEQFPFRGSIPPELGQTGPNSVRQTIVAPFRLFYRIKDKTVIVILIAHGRRDLRTLLRDRLLKR